MPTYTAIVSYRQDWELEFSADNDEEAEEYALENYDRVGRHYDGDVVYHEVTEVDP